MGNNPFDFINSINYTKKDIMTDDLIEKDYNPFLTNRSLSYFVDAVIFANEMNKNPHLDNRLQFHFFINTIRKRKRFSKWLKPKTEDEVEAIKIYYGYSNEKARQAINLLTSEQVKDIKKKVNKGGRK